MGPLNVAIVDDDLIFLETIRLMVSEYCEERNLAHSVSIFADAESFLDAFERDRFTIVMLDILLPGENGIALAKKVHQAAQDTQIVFMTVSPDFALEGYGVNALRYVLKPVTRENIREVMSLCLERLNRPQRHILLKTNRAVSHVRLSSILYLESNNKRVYVTCDDEVLECYAKLSSLLGQFPSTFLQVHKSYAVNLARTRGVKPESVLMDNGKTIPISRRFRGSAASAYFAFIASGVQP